MTASKRLAKRQQPFRSTRHNDRKANAKVKRIMRRYWLRREDREALTLE